MERLFKVATNATGRIRLEGREELATASGDGFKIRQSAVCLVRRNFADGEPAARAALSEACLLLARSQAIKVNP